MRLSTTSGRSSTIILTVAVSLLFAGAAAGQVNESDTFCHGSQITIDDSFPTAVPSVTTATSSGLVGTQITDVQVQINGLTAARPDDKDFLLIHGDGVSNLEFWSDAGGTSAVAGINVTLDDNAATQLPDSPVGPLPSGTYQPNDHSVASIPAAFGLPVTFVINHAAPVGAATFASSFGTLAPNTTWELRIVDDTGGTGGESTIDDWCVVVTTELELPVELVTFNGVADGDGVLLTWETASEKVNAGFEIQQETGGDAEVWEKIGWVEGHGTTNDPQAYSFRVNDVAPGHLRFRLKQIDYDGAFEYSPIVEVTTEVPGGYLLSEAYPNPFNPQTTFTLIVTETQDVRVEVVDLTGRTVSVIHDGSIAANEMQRFRFQANDLPSGVYLIHARGATFSETKRAVLLR